jgi:hypothetical protein
MAGNETPQECPATRKERHTMHHPGCTRTLLATLLLASALSLPGLPLAQTALPQVAHAAASQSGPVLAGTWVDYTKGARFSALEITAVTSGGNPAGLPTSILYGVSVFAGREIAFGTAAPALFVAAGSATIPLTALPTPSRFVHTTITLTLLSSSRVGVAISDSSLFRGTRYAKEIMFRPY